MAKNPKSSDVNVTAFEILRELTKPKKPIIIPSVKRAIKDNPALVEELAKKSSPTKNPAAVALGRLGGLKGGKARKASLSAKQRTEIAKKAARARWKRP